MSNYKQYHIRLDEDTSKMLNSIKDHYENELFKATEIRILPEISVNHIFRMLVKDKFDNLYELREGGDL